MSIPKRYTLNPLEVLRVLYFARCEACSRLQMKDVPQGAAREDDVGFRVHHGAAIRPPSGL